MNTLSKGIVVLLLAGAVVGVIALKGLQAPPAADPPQAAGDVPDDPVPSQEPVSTAVEQSKALPKLLDLGADKCIPCKAMAPILEELKAEYAGRMEVEFIDVWKNPDAGSHYGVSMIPTQIFYDVAGEELFRHTGFYGREDILGKWKELGVVFEDESAGTDQ